MTPANPPHPGLRESEGESALIERLTFERDIAIKDRDLFKSALKERTHKCRELKTQLSEAQARATEGGFNVSQDHAPSIGSVTSGQPAPEGWTLVPNYPTDEIYAAFMKFGGTPQHEGDTDQFWWEGDFGNFVASWLSALSSAKPVERESSRDTQEQLSLLSAQLASAVKALTVFAEFVGPKDAWLPDHAQITQGSPMAKRQLTAGDCRAAAVVISSLRGSGE